MKSIALALGLSLGAWPMLGCSKPPNDWKIAAIQFAELLQTGDMEKVAGEMLLPASLSARARTTETDHLAASLRFVMDQFGAISLGDWVNSPVSFYEIAIGGGPKPAWWRNEHPHDHSLVMLVHFAKVGEGVLRLAVVEVDERYRVPEVALGLTVERPGAKDDIRRIRDALYDFAGLPEDHPLRRNDLILERRGDASSR